MKFTFAQGYIMAYEDNDDPMKTLVGSRFVCRVSEVNDKLFTTLIEQANMLHESLEAPEKSFSMLTPKGE